VCPFDIKDSQTHAAMLARQGIISEADAQAICRGLDQVAEEIRSGNFSTSSLAGRSKRPLRLLLSWLLMNLSPFWWWFH